MSTLLQAADGMSLKSKALFFFVLTILLTLIAASGVLYEHVVEQCRNDVEGLPVSVLATLVLLIFVLAGAMLFFKRQVLVPLADVNAAVKQMIDGRLDALSRIRRKDEIGRLSENINDLAINMQEVLLFVWNHSQQSCALIEQIAARAEKAENLPGIREDLQHLQQDNEALKAIVTSFSYFEIRLEQERMLAECDCRRQDGSCCDGDGCRRPEAT